MHRKLRKLIHTTWDTCPGERMVRELLCILLLYRGAISAQDWRNVGDCGAGLNCGPRCQRLCLRQHNYYRSLHGSPPLKCDPLLAKSAQSWASSIALHKSVQRSTPSNNYVENISWKKWGWKGMETKLGAIPGAVRSWYSEIKRDYDYGRGGGNGTVTHFKNVILARESRLGCGIVIKPGDGAYVVARYSLEPGEQFQLNDFSPLTDIGPRKEPEPQCRLKSFERDTCGDLKGPFVAPDKCLKAGCCYDDIFLDEPGLQWHNPKASIWCFKRKNRIEPAAPPFGIAPQNDPVYGPDTSWQNVGSCGQGLTCGPDCQLLCLKMHNYYRALHKSTPLKCDPELAKSAQSWTDQQAAAGCMHHSPNSSSDKFTESISWKSRGWNGMDKMEGAIPGAVRSWYSEIKNNYDYDTGKGTEVIGHFQAVVWKGEQRVGCGLNIKPNDGTYVTAHYAPASHTERKDFKENVKPRKEPEPACVVKSETRVDCFGDSATEEQSVPFVTPELCIQKGCCYDDMYMDEPETIFYKHPGRTWCFKKKAGAPEAQPTQQPSTTPGNVSPSGPTQQPGSQPSSSVTPTAGPTPGSQPPSTDNCFASSCYMFVKSGKKWTENQNACKGKGGDLVSMETKEEWEYINNKIQKITLPPPNEWHIGLKKEGDWKWVSGEPLTIEKWQRSQPSGDGDFTVMSKDYPRGSKGLFNDLPDWIPRAYICEIPKGGTNQPGVKPPFPAPTMNPSGQPGSTMAPSGSPVPTSGGPTTPVGTTVGPTEGGPTGPTSGQQEGMTGFEKDCLNAHNEYRAKHGVPPLKWNQQLKQDAQEWANTLAQRDTTGGNLHDPNNQEAGENIAWFTFYSPQKQCQGPKQPDCTQCREMVKDWYDEIENYNFDTGESNGGVILHFTQVVWKETTDLGMATAMSDDIFFTVARYKPKGNMLPSENFIKNVPKLL